MLKYIKSQMSTNGEVQLQKLVYYAQAWSLAWDGRPLFPERIEAWRMGPVVRAIRYRSEEPADPEALNDEARATVDAVVEFYGQHAGSALAEKTHDEPPWRQAWERRPTGSDTSTEEISHEAMRAFYSHLAITQSDVPRRRPVHVTASDTKVRQAAAANAERWRETLAILAQ